MKVNNEKIKQIRIMTYLGCGIFFTAILLDLFFLLKGLSRTSMELLDFLGYVLSPTGIPKTREFSNYDVRILLYTNRLFIHLSFFLFMLATLIYDYLCCNKRQGN